MSHYTLKRQNSLWVFKIIRMTRPSEGWCEKGKKYLQVASVRCLGGIAVWCSGVDCIWILYQILAPGALLIYAHLPGQQRGAQIILQNTSRLEIYLHVFWTVFVLALDIHASSQLSYILHLSCLKLNFWPMKRDQKWHVSLPGRNFQNST